MFIKIIAPLLFYCLSCVGVGYAAQQLLFKKAVISKASLTALVFLFGQGIIGLILYFPALSDQFYFYNVVGFLTPGFFFGCFFCYKNYSGIRLNICNAIDEIRRLSWAWKGTSCLVILMFITGVASTAAELTLDAQAFYFVLSKVIADSHRLVPLISYESFSTVGVLAEIEISALMLLGMPGSSSRLLLWLTWIALAIVFLELCKLCALNIKARLITLSFLLTSSAILYLWGSGKTDLVSASFGVCAYFFALLSLCNKSIQMRAAICAAIFSGFCIVSKISYLVPLVPSVLLILLWQDLVDLSKDIFNKKKILQFCKNSVEVTCLFVLILLIVFIPQFYKNWLLFGAPLATWDGSVDWFAPETIVRIVLTYPFALTLGNYWGQFGVMSPLVLAFLPLKILFLRYDKDQFKFNDAISSLCVAALVGVTFWVTLFPAIVMPRYFLATLIILIIPAAFVAERFSLKNRFTNLFTSLVISGYLILFFAINFNGFFNPRNILIEVKDNNWNGPIESRVVIDQLNEESRLGARVLALTYHRFFLRSDLIQCANRLDLLTANHGLPPSDDFWISIYEEGFDYILIQNSYKLVDSLNLVTMHPEWVRLTLISKKNDWSLYQIDKAGAPVSAKLICKETSRGAWDIEKINSYR